MCIIYNMNYTISYTHIYLNLNISVCFKNFIYLSFSSLKLIFFSQIIIFWLLCFKSNRPPLLPNYIPIQHRKSRALRSYRRSQLMVGHSLPYNTVTHYWTFQTNVLRILSKLRFALQNTTLHYSRRRCAVLE